MKTHKIEFTDDMLKRLEVAIGEVPMKYGVAFLPIMSEINRQLAEQNKPAAIPQKAA